MFPATKFRPPTPGSHAIARPEVFDRLRLERQDVLVVRAPAGYGKTTAVAHWLDDVAAGPKPARHVWVTLDEDDDDPAGLWEAIAAATAGAGLDDGRSVGPAPAGGVRANTIVPLLDAFADSADDWVLVLDDAHLLTREDT